MENIEAMIIIIAFILGWGSRELLYYTQKINKNYGVEKNESNYN